MKVRRYYGLVALAALPLLIGLLLTLVLQGGLADNPVLRFQTRVDLGTLLLLVGLALTLCLAAGVAAGQWFDRRQRRALAAAQQETAQVRQRFIRRLDHELKNPLAAIRTALAYLTISSGQQKETQAWQDISAQVERLSRLTADLRKVAELEARPVEREPVNVAELLAELVTAVQASPEYANHSIRLHLPQAPWPLPVVTGDRDLLGLAFYNLLDNACKFTGPEDLIEVRAAEEGHWLVVEVADTGLGIAPEELPHLFEELYRGRNARRVAGSGLGLALAQRIAARHGGTITVRSRLEQGTIFTLRLPFPA